MQTQGLADCAYELQTYTCQTFFVLPAFPPLVLP